ncbi:S-methyl-5-thioribose-1-phosphate isomerase [Thiobacter aerophilum]|uniref:Methylthioribose-1-phosphate isomerase n=1 Tax=Thiobacter aerophilum TaxID=3121275 RepID=A0ABV0EDW3_9BURK
MRIDGQPTRTIAPLEDGRGVRIIDQTLLPHRLELRVLRSLEDAAEAISAMRVRGAPLIGATAAYGVALAMQEDASETHLEIACARLLATRPTAVNLPWALERMQRTLAPLAPTARREAAWQEAAAICEEDVALNAAIGRHGLTLIAALHRKQGQPVQVMTHCNAGWLATVDWGTALAPVYMAHDAGIPVHVWVSETRPRNQGAALTAWELARHGVPHAVIADNAAGHLMQRGDVDLVIVGADRVAANGDVANKIGTYLKALAARDNGVPFYVAVPGPSIDWRLDEGRAIPIEVRAPREVTHVTGVDAEDKLREVRLTPASSDALNPAFDVTPARLVTGLITERGVLVAQKAALRQAYPEAECP